MSDYFYLASGGAAGSIGAAIMACGIAVLYGKKSNFRAFLYVVVFGAISGAIGLFMLFLGTSLVFSLFNNAPDTVLVSILGWGGLFVIWQTSVGLSVIHFFADDMTRRVMPDRAGVVRGPGG